MRRNIALGSPAQQLSNVSVPPDDSEPDRFHFPAFRERRFGTWNSTDFMTTAPLASALLDRPILTSSAPLLHSQIDECPVLDQVVELTQHAFGELVVFDDDPGFDVALLGGFSEVGRR